MQVVALWRKGNELASAPGLTPSPESQEEGGS